MTEIRFYHLERQGLEQALAALISRAYETGRKVVIKTPDEQAMERLNSALWTYSPESFLPHGSNKEAFKDRQPVYLTTEDENPASADVLILADGTASDMQGNFTLCCEVFDGNNPDMVAAARQRWKSYKESGFALTYWQQGPNGWENKTQA